MTRVNQLPPDLHERGWRLESGALAISKTFTFESFRAALAFMVEAGFEAECANHHPEWRNVYNRVEVRLTTHDAGGLTGKDLSLARAMDAIHP